MSVEEGKVANENKRWVAICSVCNQCGGVAGWRDRKEIKLTETKRFAASLVLWLSFRGG